MTLERWKELSGATAQPVSNLEASQGWHFCPDWDDLLIGPSMGEWHWCQCEVSKLHGCTAEAVEAPEGMVF
jgi:hypothetical protein